MVAWGMGFSMLFMLLFWGALIALAVWLVRTLFPPLGQPLGSPSGRDLNACDILDRRFARGEISQGEYDLMRETISH